MTQPSTAQPAGSGAEAASAAPLPRQLEPRQLDPQQQQDQSGSTPPVALPFQDASGLPADVKAAAAAPTDGAAAAPRGHSPETGLIAVSSSASLASNGGATGGAAASNGAGPGSADGSGGGSEGSGDGGDGNRTLYLGNLHPFVTEATLQEVFAGLAGITELKVIKDKATGVSAGYGFAKFTDVGSAQTALDTVNKSLLFGQEVRVNWAFQKEEKEEVAHHFHAFVGDLSSDVTDAMLLGAFQNCPGCSDARVMWDHATGRSRGFGFVSFRHREEAEAAIAMMHGQFIGARRVRCGWAQHKTGGASGSMDPQVLDRADPSNTNVYVGNLAPALSDAEVRRHFGAFGPIAEVKLYRKGSYGFVRYKNHGDAVRAIVGMNGQALGGKLMKCSWGRHPNTPPSGVQTSLMLAAAAGLNPLAMGAAGMLGGHGGGGMGGGMGGHGGGMGGGHNGMHAGMGPHNGICGAHGGMGGGVHNGMSGGGHMGGGHGGIGGGGGGHMGSGGAHMGGAGHMGMMGGHGGMLGMPMAAAGAQALIHGGQGGGMGPHGGAVNSGGLGQASGAAGGHMLGGGAGSQTGMLGVDHSQLQQMASMGYNVAYGNGGMHSNMAFFGAN